MLYSYKIILEEIKTDIRYKLDRPSFKHKNFRFFWVKKIFLWRGHRCKQFSISVTINFCCDVMSTKSTSSIVNVIEAILNKLKTTYDCMSLFSFIFETCLYQQFYNVMYMRWVSLIPRNGETSKFICMHANKNMDLLLFHAWNVKKIKHKCWWNPLTYCSTQGYYFVLSSVMLYSITT